MKITGHSVTHLYSICGIIFALLIAGNVYMYIRTDHLSAQVETLSSSMLTLADSVASTSVTLQISKTSASLSSSLAYQEQNVNQIKSQISGVKNQVGTITGTVSTLQKLSQTDPELLKKYSKVYFLNENYVPPRLSEIPLAYEYSDSKQLLVHSDVLPHLTLMIDQASSTGIKLYVSSAYRSFAEQRALKGQYSMTYGAGTANSFSADQGYSEHQLGTTIDLTTTGLGGKLDGFDATAAFRWMDENAYKYGFILSYPKDNGYYVYEPWHWPFVGVNSRHIFMIANKNFYDLDQRTIDEYLASIFD